MKSVAPLKFESGYNSDYIPPVFLLVQQLGCWHEDGMKEQSAGIGFLNNLYRVLCMLFSSESRLLKPYNHLISKNQFTPCSVFSSRHILGFYGLFLDSYWLFYNHVVMT